MADDLGDWFDRLPDAVAGGLADDWAAAIDAELVEPIRAAAPEGKTGDLKQSVRKEPGSDDLTWIVAAGGALTTKTIGTRTYRRQINIGAGEETQHVPKGNAPVAYDYALADEFGNSHMVAQPFFWPTIHLRWPALQQRAQALLDGVVAKL